MADVRLTATNPEDSSVVPVACDASGRLLLEERGEGPQGPQGPPGPPGQDGDPFSGNFAGDVTFGGSAEFAGTVKQGDFNGGRNDATGSVLLDDGGIATQYALSATASTSRAVRIYHGSSENVTVFADGSAEFADNVSVDQYLTVTNSSLSSNARVQIQGDNDVAISVYPVISGSRTIGLNHDGSCSFAGENVNIFSNGSAEFAGDVQAGGNAQQGRYAGITLRQLGVVQVAREAGEAVFTGFLTTNENIPNNATSTIKSDGSITLAGGKAGFTAEGYLWCTTRRGDTVILDATSNGLASWVEYTPTSRIDEIRDKLDANRPDTGEMPADTP